MSSPTRPPLRGNREFWLLWIGQVTSTLPAGVAADLVDRRMLMRWCDVGRVTALAALATTLVLGRSPLIELLALALVVGASSALFLAAQSGAVGQVVARTDLPAAIARNQAYQQVAAVGGPPLGGLLYLLVQSLLFLIDAVSYLFSCLTITVIRIPLQGSRDPPGSQQPVLHRLFGGLRWIFAEPFPRALILYLMALNFVQPALVLAVILRASAGGATPTQVGMIFALSGIGGVAGALASPRIQERFPPSAVLLVQNDHDPRSAAGSGLCVDESAGKQLCAVGFAGQRILLTAIDLTGSLYCPRRYYGGSGSSRQCLNLSSGCPSNRRLVLWRELYFSFLIAMR